MSSISFSRGSPSISDSSSGAPSRSFEKRHNQNIAKIIIPYTVWLYMIYIWYTFVYIQRINLSYTSSTNRHTYNIDQAVEQYIYTYILLPVRDDCTYLTGSRGIPSMACPPPLKSIGWSSNRGTPSISFTTETSSCLTVIRAATVSWWERQWLTMFTSSNRHSQMLSVSLLLLVFSRRSSLWACLGSWSGRWTSYPKTWYRPGPDAVQRRDVVFKGVMDSD